LGGARAESFVALSCDTRLPARIDGGASVLQKEAVLALRRMSEAFVVMSKLAAVAELNVNTLYRTLSPKGNPELNV
jgi:DNA-binding phage protein